MTAIVVTAANVGMAQPQTSEYYSVTLAEAVTAGQVMYQLTSGKFGVADANGSGKQQARGIALQAGAAGQTILMIKRGFVEGYTVSSLNADVPLYLSDTAGALDDSAGTMTVICARVVALPGGTKEVYADFEWNRIWS